MQCTVSGSDEVSGAGSVFLKDLVGWPKDDNKENPDRDPIVPDENVSFVAAIITFKHCFMEDPDPDPIKNRLDLVHCSYVLMFPFGSGGWC